MGQSWPTTGLAGEIDKEQVTGGSCSLCQYDSFPCVWASVYRAEVHFSSSRDTACQYALSSSTSVKVPFNIAKILSS